MHSTMQFCSRRVPNGACVQHSSSRNGEPALDVVPMCLCVHWTSADAAVAAAVIARARVTTKTTLYEKLGGQTAVVAAVDKFYEKVSSKQDCSIVVPPFDPTMVVVGIWHDLLHMHASDNGVALKP